MIDTSSREILGHVKRVTYACVGIGLIGLGVLRRTNHDDQLPVWRCLLVVAGGLFFLYIALMYYFPEAERSRARLNAVFGEAEAAEPASKDSHESAK